MTVDVDNDSILFNGAEILLKSLNDCGIDIMFGYPGGAVIKIYDEIYKQNKIKHILARHEQGATHMAEGYAKSTGKIGCVIATSGPGATNTITGINDAYCDSIPLLVITGQVKSSAIGYETFQETDVVGITRPITKYNHRVKNIEELEYKIKEAFYIATTGRCGPVLIDIPADIQNAKYHYQHLTYKPRNSYVNYCETNIDLVKITDAVKMIENAQKPVIYAGGGVISSKHNACEMLTKFANSLNIPVVLTLMGLGAYDAYLKNFLGMVGMHGKYESNMTMNRADLIIALGARFSDRIIGDKKQFAPNAKILHIDIDESVIDMNIKSYLSIVGDVGKVLKLFMEKIDLSKYDTTKQQWWQQIEEWRKKSAKSYVDTDDILQPQFVVETISNRLKDKNVIVSTDVGQHQMWTAQYFKFQKPRTFLTSGGFGTMGFGLPACIGSAIAKPDYIPLLFSSEGSFMMNIQELATATNERLPIKVVLLNNARLGMVRQWQSLLFEGRLSETVFEILPDFPAVARAFGGDGISVYSKQDLKDGIEKMLNSKVPFILDVNVDPNASVLPMIVPGNSHDNMLLKMESNI